ncbi:MAG: hypothetical protein AAFW66_10380 [Pseudomonadota bacterium]
MTTYRPENYPEGFEVNDLHDDDTGELIHRVVTFNGVRHAPPDGGPSYGSYRSDGAPLHLEWDHHGKAHREDGPQMVKYCPETGNVTLEVFQENSDWIPPEKGPCLIEYDPQTGAVIAEKTRDNVDEWYDARRIDFDTWQP